MVSIGKYRLTYLEAYKANATYTSVVWEIINNKTATLCQDCVSMD